MEREESYCSMKYRLMKIAKCCDHGTKEVGEIIGYAPRYNLNDIFYCLMDWKERYRKAKDYCKCDAKVVVAE